MDKRRFNYIYIKMNVFSLKEQNNTIFSDMDVPKDIDISE